MKRILLGLSLLTTCFGKAQTIDLIKDLNPGAGSSRVFQYGILSNELYFVYNKELWKTDGTPSGTSMLKQLDIGSDFLTANGLLFFMADDGSGKMLWKTDGTVAGTVSVGSGYTIPQVSSELKPLNGNVFFNGCDAVHGCELWISDGTDQGTRMVKDIEANVGSQSGPFSLFTANNKLYFSESDTTIIFPQEKLWETDGINVVKVGDIFTGDVVAICNNKVYAFSDSNYRDTIPSRGVYEIDLATSAYSLLYLGLFEIYDPVMINGKVLFAGNDGGSVWSARNLYTLDTSSAHVEKINDTAFIFKSFYDQTSNTLTEKFFVPFKGKFYLLKANAYNSSSEIWQTDGTPAGTSRLALPGEVKYVNDIAAAGNILFFKAYDTNAKRVDIWYMDEQENFYRIAPPDLPNTPTYTSPLMITRTMLPDPLFVYGNSLVFTNLYDSAVGKELYKIDITALSVEEPTLRQAAIYPNPVTDDIFIAEADLLQAIISDNAGKRILATTEKKINVRQLASGIYFLDIRLKNGERRFAKFVIE